MDETVRRLTVDAALTMLHERNAPAESASTQPLRDDAETPPAATPDPPVAPAPPDDRP
jgi:hypothetical protein